MVENLITLGFLVLLQAVLGFDNLLYISLESRRAPEDKQSLARKLGIGLAVALRLILLFVLIELIDAVQEPLFALDTEWVVGEFNLHSLIVFAGGLFIMHTSLKEIWHMTNLEEHEEAKGESQKSLAQVIGMIVAMNLVFSFDSILSAIALTDVFWVMATAIIIGGVLMIVMADRVSDFLAKNRMYEVLGLFILFLVSVLLLSEGGQLAHLELFGHEITTMSKATFYFIIAILFLTDIVQGRYKKKLLQKKEERKKRTAAAPAATDGEVA
jgi:predicted tellurium resistance membrane protein TerC